LASAAATFSPVLRRSVAAVSFANPATVFTPAAMQTGVKSAPLVASGSVIHAPLVDAGHIFDVIGTLNVARWVPRAPARRPRIVWPNLPKVEAPPWRLVVVTPEVARARARSLAAQRRRAEQVRRTREARRRLDRHFDEIVEAEIAHTLIRLVSEEA
jgi:hypothetical protein